jgi:hypothetical protein
VSILVIDIGTTGARAGVLSAEGTLGDLVYRRLPPTSPAPGLVEFDAAELAAVTLGLAREALARHGRPVGAVGVSTQRASTVVWDRATGQPVAPGIGWQDLRTVFDCITLKAQHGLAFAPNQSATKVTSLLAAHDPDRARDLCFGTVDSWIAWVLTDGAAHVTDRSNAAVTGLTLPDASDWSTRTLDLLGIPGSMMPHLVDTTGPIATATALPGAPMLCALVGDQQTMRWLDEDGRARSLPLGDLGAPVAADATVVGRCLVLHASGYVTAWGRAADGAWSALAPPRRGLRRGEQGNAILWQPDLGALLWTDRGAARFDLVRGERDDDGWRAPPQRASHVAGDGVGFVALLADGGIAQCLGERPMTWLVDDDAPAGGDDS